MIKEDFMFILNKKKLIRAAVLLLFCIVTANLKPALNVNAQGFEGFPESYRAGLSALKARHPKWKFIPVNTGLDWNEVMKKENRKGRSTIDTTYPTGGSSGAPFSYLSLEKFSYNWKTDKFKLYDGKVWYCANEQVVAYYLDPRNFFDDGEIFQFQSLSYTGNEKKKVLEKILRGCFMNGKLELAAKSKKKSITYAEAFMYAGKKNKISPYFLASRARLEIGIKESNSVTGKVPGYVGIYNYYNIGANDSAGGGAILNGLRFASGGAEKLKTYGRPWNTRLKAIVGGADFLASTYLSCGQNTMYFQRFSVVNKEYLYWHQFQTNIAAASTEGKKVYEAYKKSGILNESLTFYIPVYKNMPQRPTPLPKAKGNPNHYLKNIKLSDNKGRNLLKELKPAFSYNKTDYTLNVKDDTTSVNVKAATVSKYAEIKKGTGKKKIKPDGTVEIKIVVRAQDNSKGVYTIKLYGGKESPEKDSNYGDADIISCR